MEQIHGVDVSWMTHGNPKDKSTKITTRRRSLSQPPRDSSIPSGLNPSSSSPSLATLTTTNSPPSTPPATRPTVTRTSSDEKQPPTIPQRRGSWFSNISSKFSSSQSPPQPQANTASTKPAELSVPRSNPVKNAVLQHATRPEGEGPYTPAPPRGGSNQAGGGILHVFRRLSSGSVTGSNGAGVRSGTSGNHGLVERRVLNVDRHRERCAIGGLKEARLRRVAFCVDVEVAPAPRYLEDGGKSKKGGKELKKKEKGEGEALKNPKAVENTKEDGGVVKVEGEVVEGLGDTKPPDKVDCGSKKKEKKKKSEEERKARKEKKRKQAEANGTIPMELHLDSGDDSSSSATVPRPATPKTQAVPTTNPVRIYRRCCQLRETPILKKITEQLTDPANSGSEVGMVEKLDLTGYWMQLPDLVTLGDYLAVVPVREIIMDNCGLTDEGLRVILAGLLAAKRVTTGRRRKHLSEPDGLVKQGGVVERLVLKNNKLGPEGWRHICLFLYLCRTLKSLDLSGIPFPKPPKEGPNGMVRPEQDLCGLFARSLSERLGGSTISLLNLGQTGLTTKQLGSIIDGVIKCGIRRLCLAHNDIDPEGLEHIARLLRSGVCEGLDLGGNDLRDQLAVIADAAITVENNPLWALSLADCNLKPSSLCKLLPKLIKLDHIRFLDLSHNHDLFSSEPSAISVLRRYLPKMQCLKRIHLADCSMSPEQVIALAEILPEIPGLAHISFLENPALIDLATNADTDETKEEACALYASLLAAARVSPSLVAVDIEVPSEQSSDLVKAMAKHVVAYCLRNMELAAVTATEAADVPEPEYPEALQRLVGHDVTRPEDDGVDAAPDEDYVIGGTALVKALACCLNNRGDESRRQSGEFIRDVENGIPAQPRTAGLPSGKAKQTSKHLLSTARKIRMRLQPAIVKARGVAGGETHAYHRLIFLDNTLQGIIKRFEDEFPDTREAADSAIVMSSSLEDASEKQLSGSLSSVEDNMLHKLDTTSAISDGEDEADAENRIRSPALARTNSMLSLSSKALANEEGRVLRAGHKFRAGFVKPEHYALLSGIELVGRDPNHVRMLHELLDELNDDGLRKEVEEKGVVKLFQERKGEIIRRLREADPVHWDRFVESQVMARKNVKLEEGLDAVEGAE